MQQVTLKVTRGIMVGGAIASPGELIEVTVSEAKDLLHRECAELATEADAEIMGQDGPLSADDAPTTNRKRK